MHFLQIWLIPRHRGNTPRWDQKQFDPSARVGKLVPVVSGGDVAGTLRIDQDASIYLSTLPSGKAAWSIILQHTGGRRTCLWWTAGLS